MVCLGSGHLIFILWGLGWVGGVGGGGRGGGRGGGGEGGAGRGRDYDGSRFFFLQINGSCFLC